MLDNPFKFRNDKEIIIETPIKVNVIISNKQDRQKVLIKSISLKISNKITISELIKKSIYIFNDMFYSERLPYQFNVTSTSYTIKPSKKNGQPKEDLPSKMFINF
jgi:hypothetical protein